MRIPSIRVNTRIILLGAIVFALPAGECAAETAASGSPSATAQEADPALLKKLSLEELMKVKVTTQSTISRVDEKIDEAPGSVYVYSREVIKKRGYRSLGDLLQTVPGFTVFNRDLDFVVGVRGLNANDNEKITLLINGQNLNGVHEQDFSLNGPINLDNVERVEVVVGPSSFFQQANTLAATVNIITRDVDGVEVIAAAGNSLRYSGTLMMGHHWAPDKFLNFSLTTEAKKGFDAWNRDFKPGLAGRKVTGELDGQNYFGILKGQYGEVTAQAVAYMSRWPELLIENGSRNNEGDMQERFYSLFIKDEHDWSDTLKSTVRVDATLKEQTRLNSGGPPRNSVEQSVKQWVYTGELGLLYSGLEHHRIQAGVQASYDNNFDTYFTFNTDDGTHIPKTTLVDRDTAAVGFYLDDTIQVAKWLKLIGGVRIDKNGRLNGHGDRWFPGARSAIILSPTPNWITKLTYNRSVRVPSPLAALNKVWGVENLDDPRNPSFARVSPTAREPEILSTFELQQILYIGSVRLGAAVYHEELEGFISFFEPQTNGGNFRGNGVELSLQAPLTPRLTIWGNASWNDTKLNLFNRTQLFGVQPEGLGQTESFHSYINEAGRLIGSPEYMANLGFDYKITDHLTFAAAARYFTEQAAVDFSPPVGGASQAVFDRVRNRFYLDASLTWDHVLGKEMDLRLSCRNLLDNRDPVAAQQQADTYRPRGLEVVLTVNLRF